MSMSSPSSVGLSVWKRGSSSRVRGAPRLFGAWRLGDKEDDELVANAQLGLLARRVLDEGEVGEVDRH